MSTRAIRSFLSVFSVLGMLLGLTFVVAPAARAVVGPTLSNLSLARDCLVNPNEFVPAGFVDNGNGTKLYLSFTAPSDSTWQTPSPGFTPDSDHFGLGEPERLKLSDDSGTPLYSIAFSVQVNLLDSTKTTTLDSATINVGACSSLDRPDFDGDGTNDVAVYRPSAGEWRIRALHNAPYDPHHHNIVITWGHNGDIPVAADYNDDGLADVAMWRPSNGTWYIKGISPAVQWGIKGDVPVPADYDGDGSIDLAVFRPSNGNWYIRHIARIHWGTQGDIAVPADYDGDGVADVAVYRPSVGKWYLLDFEPSSFVWGKPGDIPVPADYDADGYPDFATYRPSNNTWYVQFVGAVKWGTSGDKVVPGDYDGDGAADPTQFRPSNGNWYVLDVETVTWGLPTDIPIRQLA